MPDLPPADTRDATGPAAAGDPAYGAWAAPRGDGDLLVWPDAATLPALARENRRRLDAADDVVILGRPLPEWRQEFRAYLGVAPDAPVVMTGHQSELHHPGVWVKNAVTHATADAAGGEAWHVAVDTDAPKHLRLRWPGVSMPVSDDPRLHGAAWTGQLEPPTPAHVEAMLNLPDLPPLAGEFVGHVRRYLVEQRDSPSPMTLPGALADAQHKVDWGLGLRYATVLASGLFESRAWAAVVLHACRDARAFAGAYNAALAGHRRDRGIRDADRPMPDLAIDDGVIELPFWLDDLDAGTRVRAQVDADGLVMGGRLDVPGDPDAFVRACRHGRVRVAARALSLTLFLRLVGSDLFVHGIGGGHYDDVLDRLIRDYFGVEPPAFAVATATLFHPDAARTPRVCPSCVARKGHHLRHRVLAADKAAWLAEIASARGFHARRDVFDNMHAERRRRLRDDPAYAAWRRRRDDLEAGLAREREVWNRELFFAAQPASRLTRLIDKVRAEVGGKGGGEVGGGLST